MKTVNALSFLFIFLLSIASTYGQGWERQFGSSEIDYGMVVRETPDGGFAVTGRKADSIFLLKLSSFGDLEWERNLGSEGEGRALQVTPDGGFIIAGNKNGDNFLAQTDALGIIIWEKTFGDPMFDGESLEALQITPDGGYIMTGYKSLNLDDDEMPLIKADNLGNIEWEKTFGGEELNRGVDIKKTQDEGYIINSFSQATLSLRVHTTKTDAAGNEEWVATRPISFYTLLEDEMIHQKPDGSYVYVYSTKIDAASDLADDVVLVNVSASGSVTTLKEYNNPIDQGAISVVPTPDGGYAITGISDGDMFLWRTDANGDIIWEKTFGGIHQDLGNSVQNTSDGGFILTGRTNTDGTTGGNEIFIVKTDGDGNTVFNFILGNIWNDLDVDCELDADEDNFENWIVQADNGNEIYSAASDISGNYIMNVDSGDYVVQIFSPNNYWGVCDNFINVSLQNPYDSVTVDFPLQTEIECTSMTVDISAPFLRRCFESYYTVTYCNQGTILAEDAYLEITFDEYLTVNSSTLPWTSQDGQLFTFDLGDLEVGECSSFEINVMVDCDSTVLGQTHCVEAHIYPDTLCILPNAQWDMSDIIVDAECDNDSVRFELENIGTGNVGEDLEYIIIEDHIILRAEKHQLPAGTFLEEVVEANGATYRLETEQSIGHPVGNMPSITVEGCDNSMGNFSIGFVNLYPEDDIAPYISVDCQENLGSYDPNDKQAYPVGYGEEHYIEANTDIEYKIRFQNTGTDTAFRVVILDTLSQHLDLTSIVLGASSHAYSFDIVEGRTLRFTFDNILLPDSSTNEPRSHGFIKFKIQQNLNLPLETVIENSAAIYFDFNEPVITNTVFHTIGEHFIEGIVLSDGEHLENGISKVKVYPNPFVTETTFEIDSEIKKQIEFVLFDAQGRMIRRQIHSNNIFQFRREGLSEGVYFYRILIDDEVEDSGKVMIGG